METRKCLVRRLSETLSDGNLKTADELRIEMRKVDVTSTNNEELMLRVVKSEYPTTLRLVGEDESLQFYTDSAMTTGAGREVELGRWGQTLYVPNADGYYITTDRKDALTRLSIPYGGAMDLADLKGATGLTSLGLINSRAYGDVGNLKDTQVNIRSSFSRIKGHVYGDLATLPKESYFWGDSNENNVYSWSERAADAYMLGLGDVHLGDDVDKMLINQQDLGWATTQTAGWPRNITVHGRRTSASDAAVEALKARGCVVKVNGVVL